MSYAHSSKPRDLIDSATFLSISFYFDKTVDAAFVNFSRVVSSFPQKKHFVLMVVNFGFFSCLRRIGFSSYQLLQIRNERNLQQPHLTCHLTL